MIQFEAFELNNGLKVYVHEDPLTTTAAFNLCYNVGSRDESEDKTGFAHLFEHLMFGGSQHIPVFDEPLQKVGAQNNAFTSPDITNYYITLPAENLETAFWIESDRMKALSFDQKVLDVQKKVVIEEFKERYLNQPYGDIWLNLRPLAYKNHPYKWATIGKDISHIENANMNDVKEFFYSHYLPNNAVLVVGGNVKTANVERLAQKWFSDIPSGKKIPRKLPVEPVQMENRSLELHRDVPANALYMAYHMPAKNQSGYFEADLLSDLLGKGNSSLLYREIVLDKKLCNTISSFQTGSLDPGLLIIGATLSDKVSFAEVESAIEKTISKFKKYDLSQSDMEKVKTQVKASEGFSDIDVLNRCMKIAFAANAGDVNMVNTEQAIINKIKVEDIKIQADELLSFKKSNILRYGRF
jgi:zinc protease